MSEQLFEQLNEDFMNKMRNIERAYEAYAKKCGMTYISLLILETIVESNGQCTQKFICEETYYPKQTVNLCIKSFLDAGYVELKELPEDRRNKGISLTKIGQKYAAEKIGPLSKADEEGLMSLTAGERTELLRLLGKYEKAYCRILTE